MTFGKDMDGVPVMTEDAESKVGYRRPPKRSQFRKGESGNRKGRPKRKPGQQFADLIDRMLEKRVRVTIAGKKQLVTMYEAISRQFVNAAANGDTGAIDLLGRLKMHERGRGEDPPWIIEVINTQIGTIVSRFE